MSESIYNLKLDRFDTQMRAKAADFLSKDELFFGAVKLKPVSNKMSDIDINYKNTFISLMFESILGNLFSSIFDRADSKELLKKDGRTPVMVVTNKKILLAWNTLEISHLFSPIAELPVGTTIEFKRGYVMTIGSSKYKVGLKDMKKLKGLVKVSISK